METMTHSHDEWIGLVAQQQALIDLYLWRPITIMQLNSSIRKVHEANPRPVFTIP